MWSVELTFSRVQRCLIYANEVRWVPPNNKRKGQDFDFRVTGFISAPQEDQLSPVSSWSELTEAQIA